MATDTIRLEEFTGLVENRIALVMTTEGAVWLPTEFMLSQYITRILVTGRTSSTGAALAADPSWTQVWRAPGAKEWSCMFGILPHMPGPILIVVSPDIVLSAKIIAGLREVNSGNSGITIVMRSPTGAPTPDTHVSHVFFPIIPHTGSPMVQILQEWIHKGAATPRTLDLKALIPQLAIAGYGLMIGDGVWQWYRPADSAPLTTLTSAQIGRQLTILGALLEGSAS